MPKRIVVTKTFSIPDTEWDQLRNDYLTGDMDKLRSYSVGHEIDFASLFRELAKECGSPIVTQLKMTSR